MSGTGVLSVNDLMGSIVSPSGIFLFNIYLIYFI